MLYTIKLISLLALFLTGGTMVVGAFNNWKWLRSLVLGRRASIWNDSIGNLAVGLLGAIILIVGLVILF